MNQAEALAILKTGGNVFLTGEPGSGKTHTVGQYVRYLRTRGIEPAITASTGIAATHLGGLTIHSWSGIGIARQLTPKDLRRIMERQPTVKRIKKSKVLIIDEVSMLAADTLWAASRVCQKVKENIKPFGGLQVVLVGDFFQLPPVSPQGAPAAFAFDSELWQSLAPTVCYLTEQHRQDDSAFLSVLNAIRAGDFTQEHWRHLQQRLAPQPHVTGVTKLFPHNANVDLINQGELEKLPGSCQTFVMSATGRRPLIETLKKGCLSPERLLLKQNAAVMFTKNNPREGFVNGTLGTVAGFDEESGFPLVETRQGDPIEAVPLDWTIEEDGEVQAQITQIPLRLAWAITIHKSQGMSLDAAVMDLKKVFEYGQGYVALSRVRRLAGLHLLGINRRALEVHPQILRQDEAFRAASHQAERRQAEASPKILSRQQQQFIAACGGTVKSPAPGTADDPQAESDPQPHSTETR